MDENPEYKYNFLIASDSKREIILDNSIFELGEAYDAERYNYWINTLRPTWTIIPDVLNSKDGTLAKLEEWFTKYPRTSKLTSVIAVCQGSTTEEAVECFEALNAHPLVNKIGISFDSAAHKEGLILHPTSYHKHMYGRINFVNQITKFGARKVKPLHLLGCSLPQELYAYRKNPNIDSVDTSSPVVHGFYDISYEMVNELHYGLNDKHPQKLFTLINEEPNLTQRVKIAENIAKFREIANG
jgi:hypothetical protein